MLDLIHKIPIITTLFSIYFFIVIYKHWQTKKSSQYLIWWTLGVLCYGVGTLTESYVGLFGWNVWIFKGWYIFGALLGGAPLAQGTIYLLMKKKTGDILSILLIVVIIVVSVVVFISPIDYSKVEMTRLTGKVLQWQGIRYATPLINMYAFVFLVGGALYSAWKYSKDKNFKIRFIGNLLIAVGGLLPGIGGSFTKFGMTEVLYITELMGLICIFIGYRLIKNDKMHSIHQIQKI